MKLPTLPEELAKFNPEIGLILGSGLSFFADDRIKLAGRLPYNEIKKFPISTAPGHMGQFIYGTLGGKRVICEHAHFYEGYQGMSSLASRSYEWVQTLFVTNVAGGINLDYKLEIL